MITVSSLKSMDRYRGCSMCCLVKGYKEVRPKTVENDQF